MEKIRDLLDGECGFVFQYHDASVNPFVLPNLEPKCAPGDPILYPESIFCYSP